MEGLEGIAELTGKLPSWNVLGWGKALCFLPGKTGVVAVKDDQRSQVSGQVRSCHPNAGGVHRNVTRASQGHFTGKIGHDSRWAGPGDGGEAKKILNHRSHAYTVRFRYVR